MTKTTTKSMVRQQVLAARRAALAEREAKERAIVEALSEVAQQLHQAAGIEDKLEARIARIRREAEERIAQLRERAAADADQYERAAGAALRTLREHGEPIATIAEQTGQSQNRLRRLMRLASPPAGSDEVSVVGGADQQGAADTAEPAAGDAGSHVDPGAAAGASAAEEQAGPAGSASEQPAAVLSA